ncbi:MAG: hypothetical protein HYX25_03280 [Candidatus Solibacter usitatus]|nr:hypothetical protein [Candidatus Solibacter usitatus]
MFQPKQIHLGSGVFLIASLSCYADGPDGAAADSCAKLAVQVANAGAPPATLAQAQAETTRIFREARIVIEWEEYRVSQRAAGCPVRLIVSILPHATVSASDMALGSSGSVVHSLVFLDRIEELARTSGSTVVILGHAMAHEIGHLLMGPAHSEIGLMRPRWDRGDIKTAARGRLRFTPAQTEALRARVAQRADEAGLRAGRAAGMMKQ